MKKLTLKNCGKNSALLLDYNFIDQYMPKANGEYVKVYLLLLRHQNSDGETLSISEIADLLEDTEKDVVRALNYWKNLGLLDYEISEVSPSAKEPAAPPKADAAPKDSSSPDSVNITPFRNRKELKELLFVAEQYLGKTLSATDMKTITYFYDTLHMSTDLIEYLIEYCVENGHKSIHYIQKVALSWADRQITTIEAAKQNAALYNRNYYAVLKAFGITGRAPAPSELVYIRRWMEDYGFSAELVLEACSRTMSSIHQPSFDYTESILKSWKEQNVGCMQDIERLDLAFQKEKGPKKKPPVSSETPRTVQNKFNNFKGREYENMDDLTRRLIQNQ